MIRIAASVVLLGLLGTPLLSAQAGDPGTHAHHPGHGDAHDHAAHADHGSAASPHALDSRAAAQLEAVRRATERYRDFAAARADGYVRFGNMEGPLVGEHWYREDLVDAPLDLSRPSTLQYAVVDGERILVGVAYTVYQRPGEPLPEGFAGDADHWHVHDVAAIARAGVEGRPLLSWLVERGIARGRIGRDGGRTRLVMLHAWPWLENPDGPFADQHRALPYLRAGLPAEFAFHPSATEASAWGIALLTDGTCDGELRRLRFVRLTRAQRRELAAACEAAAERVRGGRSFSVAELNASAAAAWSEYAAIRDRVLTPEQHARLATIVEHPGMSAHGPQ